MSTVTFPCSMMLVAGLCVVGCKRQYANYCPGAPHDNCLNADAPIEPCTSDQQCAPNVCDLTGSKLCVQCTSSNPAACTSTTPVCGADNTCHGCTSHAQCGSNVCLPDGSCAPEASVAYVAEGGSGTTCGKLTPCATLGDGLNRDLPYVKVAAGLVKDTKTTTIDGQTVTILADVGAKLDRDGDGATLEVRSSGLVTTDVQIFDLEITGATGIPGGDGVRLTVNGGTPVLGLARVTVDGNQGIGILATGGSLTISRSTISSNTGGGISLSGAQFDLTNNFIVNNGSPGVVFGGLKIDGVATSTGIHRLEFNTVTGNQASGVLTAGVVCSTIAVPLTFRNSIVFRNGVAMQVEGTNCTWNDSDIGQPLATGTGNLDVDPVFVGSAENNFHLQSVSPARNAADPAATLAVDFDGDARPQEGRSDLGADEVKP